MVIGMLLVIQFNSIRRAVINVIVLPYAFVGVTIGLLATGSYFGFMTLLGIISLFGVVINNANVLIDRIDLEIAEGMTPPDAILAAAKGRLRPILLTTATTVLGLIPLWLGGGPSEQAAVRSDLHRDDRPNVLAVLSGTKRVLLVPPADASVCAMT